MLKKNKRNLMLMSGLAGSLIVSTAAGVALSSCTTTSSSSNSNSSDIQYSDIIDWNDTDIIKNLVVDSQGLVYSSNAMTEIIGVSPNIALPTVTIPSTVKSITGYKKVVTTNGVKTYQSVGAFEGLTSIISIVLPSDSQLESIGGAAFQNCTNLMSIQGSVNSLKFVGNYAFNGCTNLSTINLSDVISVGSYAFNECSSLKTAFDSTKTDKSGSLVSVGQYAFNGCTSLTDVNLNKAISIGQYAFYNCSSLVNTYSVDATIQTVGQYAFYGCAKITSINLSNATTIGQYAFYSSSSLTNVDLANVTSLGQYAFYGCSSITTINLAKITELAANAFQNCTSLETVNSPNLTNINSDVFSGCTSLTTIDLSKVTRVYRRAFQNCTSLREIGSLENLVTTGFNAFTGAFAEGADLTLKLTKAYDLSDNIFNGCKGIKKLDFTGNTTLVVIGQGSIANSSVEEIDLTGCTKFVRFDPGACQSATSLKTVYLPETGSNITIGANAFNGDTSLTTIATKATDSTKQATGFVSTANVTTIGAYAFQNTAVSSIDLTNYKGSTSSGVTTTGSVGSFQNMPSLSSVTIGESITRLDVSNGKGLFYGSGLTGDGFDVTLPSSIKEINVSSGASAFSGSGVRSIDASKITSYWTDGTRNNTAMTGMFSNCSKLEKVILKTGTTTIQSSSFTDTPALKTVVIPTESSEDVSNVTGFRASNTLTSIQTGNFNSTSLETIDLTNMTSANISSIPASTFTNLPTSAVVKLPKDFTGTLNSSSFTTTASTSANVQYPSGVTIPEANISTGKLTNTTFLSNISGSLDLSSNTTITSVGENTFFGTSLESLTLPAASISSANIFSTATTITANAANTTEAASYTKANVPFGNNTSLTGLNYSGFTKATGAVTDAASLFNTTSATTWTEVAKIINSLSYQSSPTTEEAAKALKANMSTWTAATSGATSPMYTDAAATWAAGTAASGNNAATPAQVTVTNSFKATNSASAENIVIKATDTDATFVHNGITWTYKNDGTNITLTASDVNMYKLTSTATGTPSYLAFFNQTAWKASDSATTTYYVPATQSVNVTLTIASASSNAS